MRFRNKEREEPDVNLTPLIDIVFLLLIFFMVSTTFKHEFEVAIELPKAESDAQINEKTLEITISSNGTFYVNGRQLVNSQAITIRRALEKMSNNNRKMPVIISADAQTPHQSVITALDAARKLGFSRVTFATQQGSGS